LSSHVPTYVDSCHGIVGIVALPGIEVRNCWGGVVGDEPVKHVGENFLGDIVVEFLDLFPNVAQECVAGPATDNHKTGQPPRNIAIAAPKLMECVPILFAAMWSESSPIAEMASHNAFVICLEVMWSMQSYLQLAEIGGSSLAPG
jgi:hypothetical protein